MDPLLFGTASAFGLAAASGLNASLPLLIVGVLARLGLLTLGAPFDALASDIALGGLAVLAVGEIAADKIPGADTVVQVIQTPLTLGAGAVLFASQNSMIQEMSPGLAILVGLLTAGGIHTLRAVARPVINVATMGIGGPVASVAEDVGAVTLTALALLAPVLAVVALAGVVVIGGRLAAQRLGQRRQAARAV